jgi:hypothetical protein
VSPLAEFFNSSNAFKTETDPSTVQDLPSKLKWIAACGLARAFSCLAAWGHAMRQAPHPMHPF